jgi:RHS repeat-associated protein
VDDGGNKISTHHYMPFGDEKPLAGRLTSNNMKFTGHERDVESASFDNPDGLDYMLARYYSSSLGRFMSPDPGGDTDLENPQSWNLFTYTRNNPLAFVDPTGTISQSAACWAGLCGFGSGSGRGSGGAQTGSGDAGLPPDFVKTNSNYVKVTAEPELEHIDGWVLDWVGGGISKGGQVAGKGIFAFLKALFSRSTARHLAEQAGREGLEAAAKKITFGTAHAAPHWAGKQITQAEAEAAIAQAIQASTRAASGTGSFWGKVVVKGEVVQYRAYTLADGTINVGTYFMPGK